MEGMNAFQKKFFEALSSIQEECVCAAVSQKQPGPLDEQFYELSAGVILRVLELIDGYADSGLGRLEGLREKTGQRLKARPFVELHDAACAFLKGTGNP